jgi:hypothetical protein
MRHIKTSWMVLIFSSIAIVLASIGCTHTPVDLSEAAQGPVPLREQSPLEQTDCSYEQSLTGGKIFTMYCGYCHNARSLAERPFSNYQNATTHMRVYANLTGLEYAKLEAFLRRWHDVPPPNIPVEPSPKRFYFSQPISELQNTQPVEGASDKPKP